MPKPCKTVAKKKPTDLWNNVETIILVFESKGLVLPCELAYIISNFVNPPLPYILSIGPKRNAASAFTGSGSKRALRGLTLTGRNRLLIESRQVWSYSWSAWRSLGGPGPGLYPEKVLKQLVGSEWTFKHSWQAFKYIK
jgi:hypothetical protein